jgi:hypothetical protein
MLFLKSSVKVVRHRNRDSFCGRLWKKEGKKEAGRDVVSRRDVRK